MKAIACPASVAVLAVFASFFLLLPIAHAQGPQAAEASAQGADDETGLPNIPGVKWQTEGKGELGERAEIAIPKDFVFTGKSGTQTLMKLMQNPVSNNELGFLAPPDLSWFLVFEYDESGYIKDDEKNDLDADAILAAIKAAQENGNEIRRKNGWSEMQILGWFSKPRYNEQTHNLEWATKNISDGHEGINYNTRLLGRAGVMEVVLVGDPKQVPEILPVYQGLLQGYAYKEGHRYAEWRQGDKVAAYGLAALAAGGATVMAAKAGLLAKFWKLIVIGLVVVGSFFKKIWNRIRTLGTGGSGQAGSGDTA